MKKILNKMILILLITITLFSPFSYCAEELIQNTSTISTNNVTTDNKTEIDEKIDEGANDGESKEEEKELNNSQNNIDEKEELNQDNIDENADEIIEEKTDNQIMLFANQSNIPTETITEDSFFDSEYNFSYRFITGSTTFEAFGGNTYSEDYWTYWAGTTWTESSELAYWLRIESESQKGKMGGIYHNVGNYNGKTVSLKITLMNWDKIMTPAVCSPNNKIIYPCIVFKTTMIGLSVPTAGVYSETVINPTFKYEFIDESTGKKIDGLKTKMTFYGGSRTYDDESFKEYKKITAINPSEVKKVNLTSNTKYVKNGNSYNCELYYTWRNVPGDGSEIYDKRFYITFLIDNGAFTFSYNHYTSISPNGDEYWSTSYPTKSTSGLLFDSRIINKYSTPEISKKIGKEIFSEGTTTTTTLTYNFFVADVGTDYYKYLYIEDPNLNTGFKISSLKIVDDTGKDVTSSFNISYSQGTNKNSFKAELKNVSDSTFYNKSYQIIAQTTVTANNINILTLSNELAKITTERKVNESNPITINVIKTVSGTENWVDNNNSQKLRPTKYTVKLYADGKYLKESSLSSANWSFDNLPRYNATTGKVIAYTIKADNIKLSNGDIYVVKIESNSKITYTLTGTVNLNVEKIWADSENKNSARPDNITIVVNQNGKALKEQTINKSAEWKYNFSLNKYDGTGKLYTYTVDEKSIPTGYTKSVNGTKITNTLNKYKYTVEYYFDNKKDETLTDTFEVLYNEKINSYKDKIKYGYVLDKVENKGLTVSTDESKNIIKVYYKTVYVEVKGTIAWEDNNNILLQRPKKYTVKLLRDGKEYKSQTFDNNKDNTYSFGNFPKYSYETGKEYIYTIQVDDIELDTGNKYKVSTNGNSINYKLITRYQLPLTGGSETLIIQCLGLFLLSIGILILAYRKLTRKKLGKM